MAVGRFTKSGMSGYSAKYTTAWAPNALGGTITTAGGYKIHTFTAVGASTFQVLANLTSVEYLVVAGGGARVATVVAAGPAVVVGQVVTAQARSLSL